MSSIDEIQVSIDEYSKQLEQVEQQLKICDENENQSDRKMLEDLKSDLQELLQLTLETLNGLVGDNENLEGDKSGKSSDSLSEDDVSADSVDDNTLPFKIDPNDIPSIVGQKCSAPHRHQWGSISYHNGLICELNNYLETNEPDLSSINVRILFTNPTHIEMLPCSYFLNGHCKFDDQKCKFSHGELIPLLKLRMYKEPDFSLLNRRKSSVLAKRDDRLWYRGTILFSNFETKICTVRLEQMKKDIDFPFEDILPIDSDDMLDNGNSDLSSDSDNGDLSNFNFFDNRHQILTTVPRQAIGEWEKHTKGIGSKIMQKYGYIIGTALGTKGEGIIVPISAQILPTGRSLDYCMELREQANGDKDLFSVERKLIRQKKKLEAKNAKIYQESEQSNVFSIINSISNVPQSTSKSKVEREDLKNHSTKTLNVASFKIAEDIKREIREIDQIKIALSRHPIGSDMYKRRKLELSEKMTELKRLELSEKNLNSEKSFRKDKNNLCVF